MPHGGHSRALLLEGLVGALGPGRHVEPLHIGHGKEQHADDGKQQHRDQTDIGAQLGRPERREQKSVRNHRTDERAGAGRQNRHAEGEGHGDAPPEGDVRRDEHEKHIEAVDAHDNEPRPQEGIDRGLQEQKDDPRHHGGDDGLVQGEGLGGGRGHGHGKRDGADTAAGQKKRFRHMELVALGEGSHDALGKTPDNADDEEADE